MTSYEYFMYLRQVTIGINFFESILAQVFPLLDKNTFSEWTSAPRVINNGQPYFLINQGNFSDRKIFILF